MTLKSIWNYCKRKPTISEWILFNLSLLLIPAVVLYHDRPWEWRPGAYGIQGQGLSSLDARLGGYRTRNGTMPATLDQLDVHGWGTVKMLRKYNVELKRKANGFEATYIVKQERRLGWPLRRTIKVTRFIDGSRVRTMQTVKIIE